MKKNLNKKKEPIFFLHSKNNLLFEQLPIIIENCQFTLLLECPNQQTIFNRKFSKI